MTVLCLELPSTAGCVAYVPIKVTNHIGNSSCQIVVWADISQRHALSILTVQNDSTTPYKDLCWLLC